MIYLTATRNSRHLPNQTVLSGVQKSFGRVWTPLLLSLLLLLCGLEPGCAIEAVVLDHEDGVEDNGDVAEEQLDGVSKKTLPILRHLEPLDH